MTDKLLIERELLERLAISSDCFHPDQSAAVEELRAALAAPRQPEGEAVSILLPALRQYMHNDGSGLLAGYEYERTQQIVAELLQECERLREALYQERTDEDEQRRQLEAAQENLAGYRAERDTLRQQLADRDAEIEEWSGTAVQNGMECDRLTAQRDKLAGLLREKFPRIDPENPYPLDEAKHCCEYTLYQERERLHREIDAALAEVEKAR